MERISLSSLEFLVPLGFKLVRACVIVLIALIATAFVRKAVKAFRLQVIRLAEKREEAPDLEMEKRAATLAGIVQKTAAVLIWAIAIIMVLREGGFDIAPILAGAGVAGLAVGFGAQNLVRDVIAGLFILLENQLRVNDVAVINGTSGMVEEINLRTTVLRSTDGAVHVFPNGAISQLSNLTYEYSYYIFDITLAYKEDTDRVVEVVKRTAAQLVSEAEFRNEVLAPIEVMGIDKLGDNSVVLKARLKTRPIQQWKVGREMNRRLKKAFAEAGIDTPATVAPPPPLGDVKPVRVRLENAGREEMRALVLEVLKEMEEAKNAGAGKPPAAV
jgi:moderate conductance mechanosensitive channel